MDPAGVDNDTQGWILCTVSGIACVVGASIICVDVPIRRLIPGQRDFRIQDSSVFLASSLSLSFGVMIFSALYSMLPSAVRYLAKDEWNKQSAGFVVMACFVGGFVGIQILSRLLHRFIPSHVVDCDHTHADSHPPSRHPSRASRSRQRSIQRAVSQSTTVHHPSHAHVHAHTHGAQANGHATESTPLLSPEVEEVIHVYPEASRGDSVKSDVTPHNHAHGRETRNRAATTQTRRPSMLQVPSRVLSFVKDTKPNCDEFGPCFGYSDPCGQECFKHISTRSAPASRSATILRTTTGSIASHQPTTIANVAEDHEEESASALASPIVRTSRAQSRDPSTYNGEGGSQSHAHHIDDEYTEECCSPIQQDLESQDDHDHHHHVPTNAFLSIGLQTVCAIALHKFPEGFITYATSHASPSLGFNVFMALFVHNIAEGFAMALPLYMALGSRFRAILWSSLLGGLSQPMGAGMAVLWFKIAKRSHYVIDNTAYAVLFAVTAGIMTSVALQLFVESLSLNHNRNLSILFAFLGMTLLGVSNALVAD
ncbi:ZIP zinc transporter [Podospora appendiculata]|uniref:ZIP zinc transporter n=1 Tax=Podospora appendiculata TaxID=314037 RepID=A0AAE0XGG7_9PEZI|nr:ZIP zinc transporter [Podospora appendiculata]